MYLLLVALITFSAMAPSEQIEPAASVDDLYDAMAGELAAGAPLVVTAYAGMWFTKETEPEQNLNWAMALGHFTMMNEVAKSKHAKKLYVYRSWKRVYLAEADADPLRTVVYRQTIAPSAAWKKRGVTEPFTMYLVLFAYSQREAAGVALASQLFEEKAPSITLDDGTVLDLTKSPIVGYLGHNFFYDFDDFSYPAVTDKATPLTTPKGLFAIGCNTGKVPGFIDLLVPNVVAVLFTKDFMAVEGHSTLALLDGVARGLSGKAMAKLADKAYRYYHELFNPGKKVGKHFLSHDYGLFE